MLVATRNRLAAALFTGLVAAGAAAVAAAALESPGPRLLAGCDDTVDTTDSFSMNCVPTMIPDMSDQLTEAEVAQPGWNAVPGGSGGSRR